MSKRKSDRAAAKRIVAQQRAADRRRTVTLWTSVAVVAVLVIAGLIGWAALGGDDDAQVTTPAGAVADGTAFAVGDGPVKVDIYEDFMCPACAQFESQAAATLDQLVTDKKVTVQYHPIAILDRFSNGTEYSTRSAAAAGAAGAAGKFREYHRVLFANQPAEGSDGLDDAKLIELGRSAGITDASFADAINDRTYVGWATKVTETASARGVTGTPTVLVNGKKLANPSPAALQQEVAAAAG
jgi:protein-disulfide isomerase